MCPWDRENRHGKRSTGDTILDDYAAYIPYPFNWKPIPTERSPMARTFPYQHFAKTCPNKTYTANRLLPNYETNKLPFANSSSSKIQLQCNTGLRLSNAVPVPSSASPCYATFPNDRLHERSLSGAHLSHHAPESRRQIATCQFE